METVEKDVAAPLFTAVSRSTRQLYLVLRCINFSSKVLVRIAPNGIHFSTEETRVMQGSVFLEQNLFTSYVYNGPPEDGEGEGEDEDEPIFQISFTALLETLQMYGFEDKDRWANRDMSGVRGAINRGGTAAAFDNRVLGMPGLCRFSYAGPGEPFCVILEEDGITTTCNLITYEPGEQSDIPFERFELVQKIITRSTFLYDAITELSSVSPSRVTIKSSPEPAGLSLYANGYLGSVSIEFPKDGPRLLETFEVRDPTTNVYKYSLLKAASRAMSIASKVSIRTDSQGVLSMQFMIEVMQDVLTFVDFRFVPLTPEDDDEEHAEDVADGSDEMSI